MKAVCTTTAHVYGCVIAVATMHSSGALWEAQKKASEEKN